MVDVTQKTEMVWFFGEHYARQAAQLIDVATGAVGLRRTGLRFPLDHCCGKRVLEAVLGDDCSDAVCELYAQAVEEELDALVSETDDDQHREGEILDYVTIDLVELGRRLRRRGNRPARPCVAGGRPLCRRASRSVSDRDRSGSIGCERNAWQRRLR